ncbi:MAG: zinc ribbon domain-containing protein [bacterium]
MFKCGSCGSGITGEEKINAYGKRYVYYRCNRHAGRSTCNEKHVREEALAEGLASLCESMSIYKPQLDKKLTKEVDKINEMQKMIH